MADHMGKDSDDFKEQMLGLGVRPLEPSKKHHLSATKPRVSLLDRQHAERRLAASGDAFKDPLDAGGEMEWLGPNDVLEFRRAGVQHSVYRSLRQGQLVIGASLDLHGLRVEEARRVVWRFVHDCSIQGYRCGLIVHGKGWHAESAATRGDLLDGKARLKSHVNRWLKEIPIVLAFCSAQLKDGGTGAAYILVKRNSHDTVGKT